MVGKATWSVSAEVALLAWIDFCKESKTDFKKTIIQHLKDSTGKDFSADDILGRLRYLRSKEENYSLGDNTKSPRILDQVWENGSATFEELPDETRRKIKRALIENRRNNDERTNSSQGPSRGAQEGILQVEKKLKKRPEDMSNGKQNQAFTPVEGSSTRSAMVEKPTTGGSKKRKGPGRDGASNQVCISSNQDTNNEIARKEGNLQRPSSENPYAISGKIRPSPQMADSGGTLNDGLGRIRELWARDTEDFYRREEQLKETIHRLEAEKSDLELAKAERDRASGQPYEEIAFQKYRELWSLSDKIQKIAENSIFAQLDSIHESQFETSYIDKAVKTLQFELASITCGHDFNQPLLVPKIKRESEFGALIRSVLNIGMHDIHLAPLKSLLLKFEPQHVIQMFLVAALQNWVFMSDFPNFTPANDRYRYLEMYRRIVVDVGGSTQLRNLDLQAHRHLLDSPSFRQATLPRKARQLTVRFSTALAPLVSKGSTESGNGLFETWGEDQSTSRVRQDRLNRIFEVALDVKASSVMSCHGFQFLTYRPGTSILQSLVQTHADSPIEKRLDRPGVRFWRLASFRVFESTVASFSGPECAGIIQTRNFIANDANESRKGHFYSKDIIIVKAASDASNDDNEPIDSPEEPKAPSRGQRVGRVPEIADVENRNGSADQPKNASSAFTSAFIRNEQPHIATSGRSAGGNSTAALATVGDDSRMTPSAQIEDIAKPRGVEQSLHKSSGGDCDGFQCGLCGRLFKKLVGLKGHKTKSGHGQQVEVNDRSPSQIIPSPVQETRHDRKRSLPATSPETDEVHVTKRVRAGVKAVKTLQCPACEKTFSQQNDCDRHSRKAHNFDPMRCLGCQNVFRTRAILKNHQIEKNCRGPHDLSESSQEHPGDEQSRNRNSAIVDEENRMDALKGVNIAEQKGYYRTNNTRSRSGTLVGRVNSKEPDGADAQENDVFVARCLHHLRGVVNH